MNNELYARWNAIENEKRAGLPPILDPTVLPTSATILRIRKENQARDVINSRAWDNFHATPATGISSDNLKTNGRPVYNDMNPICSRTNTVQYRIQPQYIPDPPRAATKAGDLGNAPPAGGVVPPSTTFSGNQYTQRLDAGGFDARNTIRELRGAVTEDNRELATDNDRKLIERQFYDRWLPAKAAADAASLEAYELLRPQQGYQSKSK
jgi:hypothetical protein